MSPFCSTSRAHHREHRECSEDREKTSRLLVSASAGSPNVARKLWMARQTLTETLFEPDEEFVDPEDEPLPPVPSC